jgi:hypothetical protein
VIVPETEAVAGVVDVVVVVDATVVDVLVVALGAVVVVVDATVVDVLVVALGAVVVVVVDDGEATATGTSTVASPQAPDNPWVRMLLSTGSTDSPHRYFTATQRCR